MKIAEPQFGLMKVVVRMEHWICSNQMSSSRRRRRPHMLGGAEMFIKPLELVLKQSWPLYWHLEAFLLPLTHEITNAGKEFTVGTLKAPFLCAQLMLLDGQFENHWKATFLALQQKIDSSKHESSQSIPIFIMTNLPRRNWTGTYSGDLAGESDRFPLYFLKEEDDSVIQTAQKRVTAQRGMRSDLGRGSKMSVHCPHLKLPDILLYINESVCSCASLGFVGTAESTIAESIELIRKHDSCSSGAMSRT